MNGLVILLVLVLQIITGLWVMQCGWGLTVHSWPVIITGIVLSIVYTIITAVAASNKR